MQHAPLIPAKAGIQGQELGPRFRGDERNMSFESGRFLALSYCVSWMRLTSAAYLAPYLSQTGFTASWKGFLSAIWMTLTP